MTNHVPGPWVATPHGTSEGDIATVYGTSTGWVSIHAPEWINLGDKKVVDANVQLITAAPDLLEALQHIMVAHGEQLDYAFQRAQEAIAKATGETE
jgi:hypothetical protein